MTFLPVLLLQYIYANFYILLALENDHGDKIKFKKLLIGYDLTNPTLVTDHIVAVVSHLALGNVISEIGFSHLVARVQMDSQVKGTMRKVSTIYPLAVNPPVIYIVTTGRYTLTSINGTVESLIKSRITLSVL